MLAAATTWWNIWNLRDVEWTALRFVWALTVPALIHVRAGLLVSEQPGAIPSWQDHYFKVRVLFFGVGIVIMTNLAVLPWVMGSAPWFEVLPNHAGPLILAALYVLALTSEKRSSQGTVVLVNLSMVLTVLAT